MLEQQQNQLMAYLRNEESQIEAHIANQGGVAIEARLGIYRNAYNMRLRESIEVATLFWAFTLAMICSTLWPLSMLNTVPHHARHCATSLTNYLDSWRAQSPFAITGRFLNWLDLRGC